MTAHKPKRLGTGLEIRTYTGSDKRTYLVMKTGRGSYHVFVETEAKDAARKCGATKEDTSPRMWDQVWKQFAAKGTQ